jgi:hypothetical protein
MKIKTWIEIGQDVEIDIGPEDILAVYSEGDTLPYILYNLSRIDEFLRGVSDERIAEMTPGQREIISGRLGTQAQRFDPHPRQG